jgi:hypothetical protein
MGTLKLPRISGGTAVGTVSGSSVTPSPAFAKWWDQVATALEGAISSLQTQEAAQAAQLTTIQRITQSISFTEGLTIGASAGSAMATISISTHECIYLDIPAVAVAAGTIANVPFGTDALIYYDDPNRQGGAVTYAYTTDPNAAATSDANPGRVFVGEVLAPASATAAPTTGVPPSAPTRSTGKAQQ